MSEKVCSFGSFLGKKKFQY